MDGPRRAARTRRASAGLVVLAVTAFLAAPLLAVGTGAPASADSGASPVATARPYAAASRTDSEAAAPSDRATLGAAATAAAAATPAASDAAPADGTPAPTPPADGTPQPAPTPPADGSPQQGTTPTATPTAPPSGTPAVDPTIRDPGDVTTALARVHGSATPGHTVRVQVGAAGSTVCTARAATDGTWACTGPVRSGPEQVFAATDLDDASRGTALSPASDIVVPPTVTTTGTTAGILVGTAVPGADVSVAVSGSSLARSAVADPSGRWRVSLRSAPGGQDGPVSVTTTQLVDTAQGYRSELRSAASAPVTVVVDSRPPAAPTITGPRTGSTVGGRALEVRGTGTTGDAVTVYADRVPVCRVEVAADRWACTLDAGTLRPGPLQLTALAVDRAGNHSPASSAVRVLVGPSATATPGVQDTGGSSAGPRAHGSGDGSGHATGGTHAGGTSGTGHDGSNGSSDGTGGSSSGTGGDGSGTGDPGGAVGPSTGSGGPRPDVATDWSLATHYDAAVPDIRSAVSWHTTALAGAAALGFLLLVVVPLGLARRRTDDPGARARPRLTGRNRPRADHTPGEAALPGWAAATLSVALAAVLLLLATGVAVEARYARLAAAVLLGSALLTAGAVLATRWAAGSDRGRVVHRVSPWLVVGAVAAAAVTRIADCSPALALGVLLVPMLRPRVTAEPLGDGTRNTPTDLLVRCATWRSTALLLLAVTGWVVHSAVVRQGAWSALVAETAITLCIGGVWSLVAGLLPLPGTAGAALWDGARVRFVALAVAACSLAAALCSAPTARHVPTVAVVATAVGCALAAAAVLWYRRRTARTV